MDSLRSFAGKEWALHPRAARHDARAIVRDLLIARDLDAIVHQDVDALFPDMHRAVERINRAVGSGERVGIFGDYDCDGITAAAQLVRFFQRRGIDPVVRLPHRVHDGYGLRERSVRSFIDEGVRVLITVDTGIASIGEIALLRAHGVDVIVTDHHQPREELPDAVAILHPALSSVFSQPHPSGAGVAFALVQALEGGAWEDADTDRALAMIGTVADLVELRGMNRRLVQEGLAALRRIPSGPIAELRNRTEAVTSADIAFRIAPRINAAGRMDDPRRALDALLEGGDALQYLDQLNEERQEKTKSLYDDVVRSFEGSDSPLLWAISESYPPGIVGLIAGKLTETYGRPSCVAHVSGNQCTASLRSVSCYHVAGGLGRLQDLFSAYGGHAMAAGCTFSLEDAETVRERLEADIRERTDPGRLVPMLMADAVLSPRDATLDFYSALQVLEPYGQGNPEPLFLFRDVHVRDIRVVGTAGDHLQCRIDGVKAIGFRLGRFAAQAAAPVDILARIRTDSWTGRPQPQLLIEDMRAAQANDAVSRVDTSIQHSTA